MKVKFIEDYGQYHRGMQYPIEQVGTELAARFESNGIARIFPLADIEPEIKPAESVKEVKSKPVKKGKK